MTLEDYINEAVSGRRTKVNKYTPDDGASIEEIVEWIRDLGITNGRDYNGDFVYPDVGKTMYEIGPAIDKDSTWIEVMSTMKRDIHQTVTIFPLVPRYRAEIIDDTKGESEYDDELDFYQAIDYIMDIADNPKRTIKLV